MREPGLLLCRAPQARIIHVTVVPRLFRQSLWEHFMQKIVAKRLGVFADVHYFRRPVHVCRKAFIHRTSLTMLLSRLSPVARHLRVSHRQRHIIFLIECLILMHLHQIPRLLSHLSLFDLLPRQLYLFDS